MSYLVTVVSNNIDVVTQVVTHSPVSHHTYNDTVARNFWRELQESQDLVLRSESKGLVIVRRYTFEVS